MKENVYVFQEETFNAIDDPDNGLDFEDKGMLYTAIFRYIFRNEEPSLSGGAKLAFSLLKKSLDLTLTRINARKKTPNEEQTENKTTSNEEQNNIKLKSKRNQNAIKMQSNEEQTENKTTSKPIRIKNKELRIKNKEIDIVNVNRTPLNPPKGSGAGAESVENEGKEAYLGWESAEGYGNIDDYPVSVEEPPEIDYDHMTPYQQFVFDWNIRNDVDNYDAGSVANIDWAAMYDEVERSPSFLQKRTARGLKFFIGISDKILRGDYRDDNNLTTAEEIYARSGRQQKKAFRHIQRKNDVLRSDPWKEQAN